MNDTAMKMISTGKEHKRFRDGLLALLKRYEKAGLSAEEILATTAHLVGQMIAMQDQRTMTSDRAMDLVLKNMQLGNDSAIEHLLAAPAGSA